MEKKCIDCNQVKHVDDFYVLNNSVVSRCKPCWTKRYKSGNAANLNDYEGPPSDVEGAKMALIALGYDLDKNIHEQFMERMYSRWRGL